MRPETGPVSAAPAPPAPAAAPDGAGPDEGPNWPGEADESAFLAAARESGEEAPPRLPAAPAPEEPAGSLPPLEELAGRVPPAVRAALDELFRAKFSAVRRIPAEAIDPQTSK
ncbi:MAG TPA: hypothetical protein VHC86_08760 [Opitutaceae bacterium]|nr:hypothetical protein [Opitutaceae bacterium]